MPVQFPVEIPLSSPNSFFNICKRLLAGAAGAALLYLCLILIMDDSFPTIEMVFGVPIILFAAGSLIYYSFLRSSVHPGRYFRFTEDGIEGSFPTDVEPPSERAGAMGLLLHGLFAEGHSTMDVKLNEVSAIELKRTRIIVRFHHRSDAVIRLGSISFKKRKQIKEMFLYYKEQLEQVDHE